MDPFSDTSAAARQAEAAAIEESAGRGAGSFTGAGGKAAVRAAAARACRAGALVSLGGMIVLIPFRYRWILAAHPLPPLYPDYTNLLVFAADAFLIAALALWGASLALQPRRVRFGPLALAVPLGGLTAVSVVSAVFSVDRLVSLYQAGWLVLLFGLYLYLVNEVRRLEQIIIPVGVQVAVQSAAGIAQALGQHSLGWTRLQELALDPAWKGVSVVASGGVRWLRSYGLSDHPNILGGALALGLVLVGTWILSGGAAQLNRWRLPAAGVFFLGSAALLLTFSRSAWLGFAAGLAAIALALAAGRRRSALATGAGLLAGSAIVLLPFLLLVASLLGTRLNLDGSFAAASPENQSLNERPLLLSRANELFASRPLTGIGVGAFPIALRAQDPAYPFDYQPPHIVLVDAAAETGVLGALFYGLTAAAPWALLFLYRRRLAFSWTLLGASAALAAVTAISLLDYYPWMLEAGRLWQWLVWGLWGGAFSASLKGEAHA